MNYVFLYIKRTFTKNVKKQLFLVMGIAAFMTMLAEHVMGADTKEREAVKQSEWNDMGFSVKLPDISLEEIEFIEKHPETKHMAAVEKLKVSGGLENAEYIVSAAVPDTWNITYLYGGEPERGEIVLTENTLIGSRQPVIGESIQIEVTAGKEKKVLEATVAGVVKSFLDFTGGYVFLHQDDFLSLTEVLSTEERKYDVFVKTIYEGFQEGELWLELYEKYGVTSAIGLEEEMINRKYDMGEVVYQIVIATIVTGACLAGIIYMVLQDEKKNIGILRALGAQKFQITVMVTARILLSGLFGILLGSGLTVAVKKIEDQLTYTKVGANGKIGGIGFVVVFLGGLAVLLLLQLPALVMLLKETPISLMEKKGHMGKNLIRLKNTRIFAVRHPLWWYAGLEEKRLRGHRIGLAIITVFGLLFPSMSIMMLQSEMKSDERTAVETTYIVRKEKEPFKEEEIIRILKNPCFQSAGFSVVQKGDYFVEYAGKTCNVCLQILDEAAFHSMKRSVEATGHRVAASTGEELLGTTGVLVRSTSKSASKKIPEGAEVQLISPYGKYTTCEVVLNGRNQGEVDADYYMYISFRQYCEVFGMPKIQEFSVTLCDVTYRQAVEFLEQTEKGVSLIQNELVLGNTLKELNNDTMISTFAEVFLSVLASAAFLLCYYSFYYLARTEEYNRLYAMGASVRMIKGIILLQALRSSWSLAAVNAGFSYLLYRMNISSISDQWLRRNTALFPTAALLTLILLVIGISMSAAWFAAGQVKRELEKIA